MTSKPEGPIWIDMTEDLMGLPVRTVVLMANLAMNRLDARGIGEVCFHAGVSADLNLVKKENEDG